MCLRMAAGKNACTSHRGSTYSSGNSRVKCCMACTLHHTLVVRPTREDTVVKAYITHGPFEIRPLGYSKNTWEN